MMVSYTFLRTLRIERQMLPGRGQAWRSLAWFPGAGQGRWHVASVESRMVRGLFESTLSHDLCFCGCCNKSPQFRWPKTTEIHSLPVLEARSPKSRCWQIWFHVPLQAPGAGVILGILWLLHPLPQSLPGTHITLSSVYLFIFFSLIRTLVIGFKTSHNPGWYTWSQD